MDYTMIARDGKKIVKVKNLVVSDFKDAMNWLSNHLLAEGGQLTKSQSVTIKLGYTKIPKRLLPQKES